jgi:CxxC motif-containing protein
MDDETGQVQEISGNECKEGKGYAEKEVKSPERVLTATVITEGSAQPLLPVRTSKPILKDRLKECMRELAGVKARPSTKIGQTITKNILNTGADLIATRDLNE